MRDMTTCRVTLVTVMLAGVLVRGGSDVDERGSTDASHALPLDRALRAMQRGGLADAHRVLSRLTREGGATSLVELLPEGGHGRALRELFDALGLVPAPCCQRASYYATWQPALTSLILRGAGAVLAADPTKQQAWEMLTWVQTLWIGTRAHARLMPCVLRRLARAWCADMWVFADAMLSLDSLRVHSPDQVGVMLRFPAK